MAKRLNRRVFLRGPADTIAKLLRNPAPSGSRKRDLGGQQAERDRILRAGRNRLCDGNGIHARLSLVEGDRGQDARRDETSEVRSVADAVRGVLDDDHEEEPAEQTRDALPSNARALPDPAQSVLGKSWYDRKIGVRVSLLGEAGTTAYYGRTPEYNPGKGLEPGKGEKSATRFDAK